MKSAAPFTSSTVQPPSGVGSRSTPTRSPPSASAAATASASVSGGGTTGTRRAPSATFVRHSPRRARGETAPTTRPPATSEPQVVAARRHELLTTPPVAVNQTRWRSVLDRERELVVRVAAHDVAAPAAEARLEHDRRLELGPREPRRDVHRARMRTPAAASAWAVASLSCARARLGPSFSTITPRRSKRLERPPARPRCRRATAARRAGRARRRRRGAG